MFILLFSRPILSNLTRGAWRLQRRTVKILALMQHLLYISIFPIFRHARSEFTDNRLTGVFLLILLQFKRTSLHRKKGKIAVIAT